MGSMAANMAAGGTVPPAPRLGGGPAVHDTLRRLLAELCTKSPLQGREDGTLTLREHVEEEARDLGGESFLRFMDGLYERIGVLVESSQPAENLGAVRAIDELIDVSLGESAAKISRFASHLRHVFEEKTDPDVMVAASAALGHLARAGGALTADVVEFQVKQALEWLQGERVEARRFAAVLILKEMAENAPTVFNVHIPLFIDVIWAALRDPRLAVRERAVGALRACLCVIEKRETRWRVQGYYRLFEETQKGLTRNASVESIHGSLLAIGELLRNTGEFMMARYKEVADVVLAFRDHRERLVRRAITALLPRVAHFLRDRFVAYYLTVCMDYLLAVMRNPHERDAGFAAMGEMAGAVGGALSPYLPALTVLLKEAIAPRRGRPSMDALACLGNLAAAVGPLMMEPVRSLLNPAFATGLSPTLVQTMAQIASRLPMLLPTLQDRLLELIASVLAKRRQKGGGISLGSGGHARGHLGGGSGGTFSTGGGSWGGDAALAQLALRTLSSYNLRGHDLLEFAKEHIVAYLDADDPATRREAAICCCRLLELSCTQAAAAMRKARGGFQA